ncbi:MAG: hypothetical protein QW212_01535 [Nitrososphaerales archaeon]
MSSLIRLESLSLLLLVTSLVTSCSTLGNRPSYFFLTNSEDGKYEIYVDTGRIEKDGEKVRAFVRFYPAESERERMKKEFEELNAEVEKDLGSVPKDWPALLDAAIEQKTRYYVFLADCSEGKIRVLETPFTIEVKPGTPSGRIYDFLCSFYDAQ